jgi:hypothetical protein
MIPAAAGNIFSVTAVNFTRLIPLDLKKGNLLAISFGRYNLVDLADEDFFSGGGTERFMNIAPIGPLTVSASGAADHQRGDLRLHTTWRAVLHLCGDGHQ